MNHNYGLSIEALLARSPSEREEILFDLVKRGLLDRRVCHMMLAELDMREEILNEELVQTLEEM